MKISDLKGYLFTYPERRSCISSLIKNKTRFDERYNMSKIYSGHFEKAICTEDQSYAYNITTTLYCLEDKYLR